MFEALPSGQNVSPHYMAPTPPLGDGLFNQNVLPPIGGMMNWPMPSTSVGDISMNWNVETQNDLTVGVNLTETPSGISSLLNLDSHQMELKPLDSGDLSMLETNNLSETFTQNLSLTDVTGGRQDQNMTDSLTRLANNALDNICQGSDIYKGPPQ